MNKPKPWKVGDRVRLKDGDGSVAVVVSADIGVVCYLYLDDPEDGDYYCHPDDLVAAPEEKRCCGTCQHGVPLEGEPQLVHDEIVLEVSHPKVYECQAPLPDCVETLKLMLAHMGEKCPIWGPRR